MKNFKSLMASLQRDVSVKQISIVLVIFFTIVTIKTLNSQAFKKAFGEGYQKAFIESFQKSFSEICYGKNPSEEAVRVCDCVSQKAVTELSIKQLKQEAMVKKFVEEKMTTDCKL